MCNISKVYGAVRGGTEAAEHCRYRVVVYDSKVLGLNAVCSIGDCGGEAREIFYPELTLKLGLLRVSSCKVLVLRLTK